MLLPDLRKAVLEANLELVRKGLVLYTFGNASAISRKRSLVVIKPSGVPYDKLKPADLVITDLNGKIVEGRLRPSSDLPTHLILYKSFPSIGGISHTHSEYATAWAQARRPIPCLGTTHADYFHGPVPVTQEMTDAQIAAKYEENTGHAIARAFAGLDYSAIPAVLVASPVFSSYFADCRAILIKHRTCTRQGGNRGSVHARQCPGDGVSAVVVAYSGDVECCRSLCV